MNTKNKIKIYIIPILCIGLLVAFDQITKFIVRTSFALYESHPLIKNVFHLTYIINRGAAFGMLANQRWFFLLVAVILLGACAYYWKRLSKGPWTLQIGSALLVSGAIGNGVDRYMLHGVVDFFDFRIWPIFNVADIGICVGVALVVYYLFTLKDDDK